MRRAVAAALEERWPDPLIEVDDAAPYHTCAQLSASGLECLGFNDVDQLGDGTTTDRSTPVKVLGIP